MIQLLFTLLAAEVGVVIVLMFKTPLRKLVIMALDRLKRGRGPVMVKTVAGTIFIVLSSSLYSMADIKSQSTEAGGLTPTDQVLMSNHLLEASLMGYSLLLALVIDRFHHYIREIRGLRKSGDAAMKQNRALEEARNGRSDEIKARDKEIAELNEQIHQLKSEIHTNLKKLKAAEANETALRKQAEGFDVEYNRLLEQDKSLRDQLQSMDLKLSRSDMKKHP
ncbi:hypothetical protein KSP40_PGU003377 [Platanthera guangdongensis]|uniref:Endoplasmic reticulum transmembrane protein n=1 Tax=Platanthera guangdongensis TaxID=2320717 RepID=A0ABR2MQ33_9ASPA